jgi:hypothetical protein
MTKVWSHHDHATFADVFNLYHRLLLVHVLSIVPVGVCVNGVVSSQPVLNRVIVLVFRIVLVRRIVIEKNPPGATGDSKTLGATGFLWGSTTTHTSHLSHVLPTVWERCFEICNL